jgi:hypothetical protein
MGYDLPNANRSSALPPNRPLTLHHFQLSRKKTLPENPSGTRQLRTLPRKNPKKIRLLYSWLRHQRQQISRFACGSTPAFGRAVTPSAWLFTARLKPCPSGNSGAFRHPLRARYTDARRLGEAREDKQQQRQQQRQRQQQKQKQKQNTGVLRCAQNDKRLEVSGGWWNLLRLEGLELDFYA